MNDIRRFIRYILPGLAYAIQLIIALSISDWNNFPEFLKISGRKETVSFILIGFLASGGLGYIFSLIYYGLYWFGPIANKFAINHVSVFQNLNEYIELKDPLGNTISTDTLTKKRAWAILTRFWFSRYEDNNCLKGLTTTTERMSNIVHGIGTTIIASLLSIFSWLIIHYYFSQGACFFTFLSPIGIILLVSWLLFLTLQFSNYFHAMKLFQSIINSSVVEIIMKEYEPEQNKKVIIWFAD